MTEGRGSPRRPTTVPQTTEMPRLSMERDVVRTIRELQVALAVVPMQEASDPVARTPLVDQAVPRQEDDREDERDGAESQA